MTERNLLAHPESETGLLGAILLDNAIYPKAAAVVSAEDFSLDSHRQIFRALCAIIEAGNPADLVSLHEHLLKVGRLEAVGGPSYLSSLTDNLPRLSNAEHYAKTIKSYARRRLWAYNTNLICEAARNDPEFDEERMRALIPAADGRASRSVPLISLTIEALLSKEIRPREMLLKPLLPEQGLVMLYAPRGVGKTYIGLGIAAAVAAGGKFLRWEAPRPRGVLYVDGELPGKTLQDRAAMVVAGLESEPAPGSLRFITPDVQDRSIPDLATPEGQALIEPHLENVDLLVIDNLSALCRYGRENESESWLPVQEWALALRRRGISVLFVHHSGKNGAQRGTSRREDLLDTVITLKRPSDYDPREGLRCEVHFEKTRGFFGDDAKAFEVQLREGNHREAVWTMRDLENVQAAQVEEMLTGGMSLREVAEELKISKNKVARLRDKQRDAKKTVPLSQPYIVGQRDSNSDGAKIV